jgi:hypothetical protein
VVATFAQGANAYYDILRDSTTIIGRIMQNTELPTGWKDLDPKQSGSAVRKIESLNPGQSIISYDISSPAKVFLNENNYWFLTLPRSAEAFDSWQLTALPDGRTKPVQLPSLLDESYTYTIVLPKNYQVVGLPQNINLTNGIGSVKIEIRKEKKKIIVVRSLKLSKSIIAVEEYRDLQDLISLWRAESNKPFIYKIEQSK